MEKKYLNFDECCIYLGMSKAALYHVVAKKQITCYKPSGRKLYFKVADLDKWLEGGRIESVSEVNAKVEKKITQTQYI